MIKVLAYMTHVSKSFPRFKKFMACGARVRTDSAAHMLAFDHDLHASAKAAERFTFDGGSVKYEL